MQAANERTSRILMTYCSVLEEMFEEYDKDPQRYKADNIERVMNYIGMAWAKLKEVKQNERESKVTDDVGGA